jgi:hypothetical protein
MNRKIAAQDARKPGSSHDSPHDLHPATGFKPVALPALAAAVRAGRKQPSQQKTQNELPAILRKESILDS